MSSPDEGPRNYGEGLVTEAVSHRALPAVTSGADAPKFARSLPTVIDRLIGRDTLLPAAVDLIGRSRLVTITGTAGVGKTRFAIAAAAAAESELGRPPLFVPLAPIADPSLVVGAIAAAAGLDASDGRSIGDIVADAIAQQ